MSYLEKYQPAWWASVGGRLARVKNVDNDGFKWLVGMVNEFLNVNQTNNYIPPSRPAANFNYNSKAIKKECDGWKADLWDDIQQEKEDNPWEGDALETFFKYIDEQIEINFDCIFEEFYTHHFRTGHSINIRAQPLPYLVRQLLTHILTVMQTPYYFTGIFKRYLYLSSRRGGMLELYLDHLCEHINPLMFKLYNTGRMHDINALRLLRVQKWHPGWGIYVHFVKSRRDGRWRPYGGQSKKVTQRILNNHLNANYRRAHPSLHYTAMEEAEDEFFVMFATIPKRHELTDLDLNILEHLATCMFQSLQPAALDVFLPQGTPRLPWYGLNVSLPLNQGIAPQVKPDWLASSEDEELKRTYKAKAAANLKKKGTKWHSNLPKPRFLADGSQEFVLPVVHHYRNSGEESMYFHWTQANVLITDEMRRNVNVYSKSCRFVVQMMPAGKRHQHGYMPSPLPEDPCSRLSVQFRGPSHIDGKEVIWLITPAIYDRHICRANTFVDILEGKSMAFIKTLQRRTWHKRIGQGVHNSRWVYSLPNDSSLQHMSTRADTTRQKIKEYNDKLASLGEDSTQLLDNGPDITTVVDQIEEPIVAGDYPDMDQVVYG